MRQFVVAPEAYDELQEIKDWYGKISEYLADAFVEEWRETATGISNNPLKSRIKSKPYRNAFLKRFPYVIVFEVTKAEIIVYRVVHTSRHLKHRKKKN